jgi:hypothetical protein
MWAQTTHGVHMSGTQFGDSVGSIGTTTLPTGESRQTQTVSWPDPDSYPERNYGLPSGSYRCTTINPLAGGRVLTQSTCTKLPIRRCR